MHSFTHHDAHGERAELYRAILNQTCNTFPKADDTFILSQMCSVEVRLSNMTPAECAAELESMEQHSRGWARA